MRGPIHYGEGIGLHGPRLVEFSEAPGYCACDCICGAFAGKAVNHPNIALALWQEHHMDLLARGTLLKPDA